MLYFVSLLVLGLALGTVLFISHMVCEIHIMWNTPFQGEDTFVTRTRVSTNRVVPLFFKAGLGCITFWVVWDLLNYLCACYGYYGK